ncbi:MAG: MFS transporter [Planctomycetes bacterium]|nr:MFS transporter [Planctomycetota bacterium]MBI3836189.1 MFS transporter [Planctomycetota bacterium]
MKLSTNHHPPRRLYANVNFILFWCAYGVSATGDHLSEMALLKTQDALNPNVDITRLTAGMTFTFFLPFFLFAPFAGALADRASRRGLMVTADAVRAVIMFMFASLIAFTGNWGQWGAFAPLVLVGAFSAMFSPARSALLPTIVDEHQLVRANAMLSGLGIIATMVAAKIGGFLADRYAPMVAFRWDSASFVGSAVLLLCMRMPRVDLHEVSAAGHGKRAALSEIAHGIQYVRAHRHVRQLLLIGGLVWFCGALVFSVIPAIVRDCYHGNYPAISNCRAFLGLGFILGAVLMTLLGDALRSEIAITWGLLGIGVSLGIFATSAIAPWSDRVLSGIGSVGIVLAGASAVSVMASFQSLLQQTVADRMRGRIFGLNDLLSTGTLLLATGSLALPHWTRLDRWVGLVVALSAAMMLIAGIATLRFRLARSRYGPVLTFLIHLNEFVCKFAWRLRRIGPSTIPRTGAVVITSNHTSVPDPFFLCAGAPYRPISFMVAEEYTHNFLVSWFLRYAECISVRRGTRQTSATRTGLEHLAQGKALGLFIEGGIARPGEPLRLKDGVAMLALTSGAPVVVAYISGTVYRESVLAGALAPHRVTIRFGPPVPLDDLRAAHPTRETIRMATRRIYDAILALRSPELVAASDVAVHDNDFPEDAESESEI